MNRKDFRENVDATWPYIFWMIAIVVGLPIFYALGPQPLRYPNQPIPIAETVTHPGGSLTFTFYRCNDWPFRWEYSAEWQMVRTDGFRMSLPDTTPRIGRGPGCSTSTVRVPIVPADAMNGTWHMVVDTTVHTPWHDYTTRFTTTTFDVHRSTPTGPQ